MPTVRRTALPPKQLLKRYILAIVGFRGVEKADILTNVARLFDPQNVASARLRTAFNNAYDELITEGKIQES